MKRRLWRALVPRWVRQAVLEQVQGLIARRADPLEAKIADVLARLKALEDHVSVLTIELATVRDSADHAERVAIPALSSRARMLEQKVTNVETVETRILHKKAAELRRDIDLLNEDARRMFEYWEVRTDNIYASLVSRLPELARPKNEP
jgi:hypothetical protein